MEQLNDLPEVAGGRVNFNLGICVNLELPLFGPVGNSTVSAFSRFCGLGFFFFSFFLRI